LRSSRGCGSRNAADLEIAVHGIRKPDDRVDVWRLTADDNFSINISYLYGFFGRPARY
jgi:hypothetical protein